MNWLMKKFVVQPSQIVLSAGALIALLVGCAGMWAGMRIDEIAESLDERNNK